MDRAGRTDRTGPADDRTGRGRTRAGGRTGDRDVRAIWAAIRESGRPEFAAPEGGARQDRRDRRSQPGPPDTTAPETGAERRTNEKPNPDDRLDAAELDDARDAVTTELGDARAAAKAEFDGAIADLHETITSPADVRTAETPDTAADQLKAEPGAEIKAEDKAELKAEIKAEVRAEVEAEVAKKIADLEAAHEQEKADIHARHAQEMGELQAKYEADKAESDARFDDLFARIKRVEDVSSKPDAPEPASDARDSAIDEPSAKAAAIDARTAEAGFWSEMANGPKSARKWYSDETLTFTSAAIGSAVSDVSLLVHDINPTFGLFANAITMGAAALAYVRKWRKDN